MPQLLPLLLHQTMVPMVDTTTMASTDQGIMVVIMMMDNIEKVVTMVVDMLDLSLEFRYL
jgi:hypothetical protein